MQLDRVVLTSLITQELRRTFQKAQAVNCLLNRLVISGHQNPLETLLWFVGLRSGSFSRILFLDSPNDTSVRHPCCYQWHPGACWSSVIAQNGFGVCTHSILKGEKAFDVSSLYGVIANANIYLKLKHCDFKKDNPEYRERMKLNPFLSLKFCIFWPQNHTNTLGFIIGSRTNASFCSMEITFKCPLWCWDKEPSSYSKVPPHTHFQLCFMHYNYLKTTGWESDIILDSTLRTSCQKLWSSTTGARFWVKSKLHQHNAHFRRQLKEPELSLILRK